MALVTLSGSINPLKIVATAKVRFHKNEGLVMSRRETLSAFGTPPFQHQPAVLARHSGAKAMSLGSTPVVWLKSGLSHLIRSPSCAKTVRLAVAVSYVKKGAWFSQLSRSPTSYSNTASGPRKAALI